MSALQPTIAEIERRNYVLAQVIAATRENRTIKLPDFDSALSIAGATAFHTVGIEPNDYGGAVGSFRYQFEGEEDLLHIIVARQDFGTTTIPDAHDVVGFLLPAVPTALIWIKPGTVTQHFYLGHDVLLETLADAGDESRGAC